MKTPYVGGYFIIAIALIPPLAGGLLGASAFLQFVPASQSFFIFTLFLSGVLLFFWDKWLRCFYDTEINIVFIPIEYFSYFTIFTAVILIYV